MIDRETPDHIMIHGTQTSGAVMTIYLRGGKQFKDTPAIDWQVYGSKGQVRVTAAAPISLSVGDEKIELYNYETDTTEVVKWAYVDAVKDLPPMAKNIGNLYELYATGGQLEKGFVDFNEAVKMHKTLAAMEKSSAEGKVVTLSL